MGDARSGCTTFSEGSREMRDLLGGKGANVAEMTRILGAERVPAASRSPPRRASPTCATAGVPGRPRRAGRRRRSARLEEQAGKTLGDPDDPLLVSVRSGARESMPGMLDTVLNLGLNDASVAGPGRAGPATSASPGTPTGASCRCTATSCMGIDGERFEDAIKASRRTAASRSTPSSTPTRCGSSTATFKALLRLPARPARAAAPARSARSSTPGRASAPSPTGASTGSPTTGAPRSTSSRWSSATRATRRRRASRSAATRSPARPSPSGDFLRQRPGRGRRQRRAQHARHRRAARVACPRSTTQLMEILRTLERHYGDMQDTEFTVEEGRLYMLQTRNAKRPAQAAVRFAVDAVDEGLLDKARGAADDRRRDARRAAAPDVRPRRRRTRCWPAAWRPRRARPRARSSSPPHDAVAAAADGRDVDPRAAVHRGRRRRRLPRRARASSPREGGKASHAALVARGMGVPAVTGAAALEIDVARRRGHASTATRCCARAT